MCTHLSACMPSHFLYPPPGHTGGSWIFLHTSYPAEVSLGSSTSSMPQDPTCPHAGHSHNVQGERGARVARDPLRSSLPAGDSVRMHSSSITFRSLLAHCLILEKNATADMMIQCWSCKPMLGSARSHSGNTMVCHSACNALASHR